MRRALLFAATLALAPIIAEAGLYKWVDENGKVQYSDKPPLQLPQQGMAELNRHGRVTRAAESPAERQAREAREAAAREAEQRAIEARRHDRALLESYRSVADVERERDRKLAESGAVLKTLSAQRQAQAAKLAGLARQPAAQQAGARQELAALDAKIAQRRQDVAQIRARAAADAERLKVLRGASTP
ncbi:DUF4124 domain-containing protein [Crenobacter cavernae]|uniref:DUF4124 domain-containing protein n=1 Tax=Crenobacter cavernae TaxID=2290923 RepID=A0ABY0FH35_9NEIS|nr:DUF4124 domain-containing protein [Crenobacter cavernae]RXZ44563.1 DUF4124 domain-containing protein [Crenobacter cavernae]